MIINLDTGLMFGGGYDHNLTALAMRFNAYRGRMMGREVYRMVERMVGGKEGEEGGRIWEGVMGYLGRTQMWCYYGETK